MIGAARWLPLSLAIHAAFGAVVWLARDLGEPALFVDMRLVESDAPDRTRSLRAGNPTQAAAPQPRRSPGGSATATAPRDTRAASRETAAVRAREVAPPPSVSAPPPVSAVPQRAAESPPSASPAPPVGATPPVGDARVATGPSTPTSPVAPAPPLTTTATPADTRAAVPPDAGPAPALDAQALAGPPGATSSLGATDTGASHGGPDASRNGARGGNGATGVGASTPGNRGEGDGPLALAIPGDAGLGGYGPYLSALRRRLHEALEYPAAARRRGLTGTVELEIALEASGRVNDVRLVRSSSHTVLDVAALEAARSLGRVPFPPDVRPRPLRVLLPVVFELR